MCCKQRFLRQVRPPRLCPGAPPHLKVADTLPLLWTRMTRTTSCCVLHMWKSNSPKNVRPTVHFLQFMYENYYTVCWVSGKLYWVLNRPQPVSSSLKLNHTGSALCFVKGINTCENDDRLQGEQKSGVHYVLVVYGPSNPFPQTMKCQVLLAVGSIKYLRLFSLHVARSRGSLLKGWCAACSSLFLQILRHHSSQLSLMKEKWFSRMSAVLSF